MNFHATPDEFETISKIADRASEPAVACGRSYPVMDIEMDITAAHANGCLLDLDRLLAFPDFDFAHDVFGIRRHINRSTGALDDCFVPRCARSQS